MTHHPAPLAVLPLLLVIAVNTSQAQAENQGSYDELPGAPEIAAPELGDLPQVLTASRLKQSKANTPGTVTILDGELIRDLGILNLWDVFRLVPGMTVGYVGSNDPVVSYHGTVAVEQRRLQVLVDGRSYYNASLADMDWTNLPVPLDEVERIEVTRGPSAASYGANSFLAVINIITYSPSDTHGVELRASEGLRGDDGFGHYYGSIGSRSGPLDWRLSLNQRRSDGFDFRYARDDTGSRTDEKVDNYDGYDTLSLNYAGELELTETDSLDMEMGYHDVHEDEDPVLFRNFNPQNKPTTSGEDWHASLKWHHEPATDRFFHFQVYYQTRERRRTIRARVDDLVPKAPPFEADVNEDLEEERVHAEFQQTHILSPALRIVYGVSYREDRYESDTFFNGEGDTNRTRAFSNIEYSLTPWLVTNVGGMWEDDSLNGNFFSPRGAANIHLTSNQTLRFVVSKAHRLPDPFEASPDWQYRATNVSPDAIAELIEGERAGPSVTPSSSDNPIQPLEEEIILSRELGYLIQRRLRDGLFQAEVKLFRDSLTNLIAGQTNLGDDLDDDQRWDLDNSVDLTQKGFELEGSWDLGDNFFRASYAYLDTDGTYTGSSNQARDPEFYLTLEQRMNARHSGSATWLHRFGGNTNAALTYYFTDELRNNHFERLDTRLARTWHFEHSLVELAGIYRHYLTDDPLYRKDNNWADRNHFFAEARIRF
jgi:iron complex outermembrane receptor protein